MLDHNTFHVSKGIMSMESGVGGGTCPGWIANRKYGLIIAVRTQGAVVVLVLLCYNMQEPFENESLLGHKARLNTRYLGSAHSHNRTAITGCRTAS
jgi:hypothetical protein